MLISGIDRPLLQWLCLIIYSLISSTAFSSNLSINPTTIELSKEHPIAILTVKNQGNTGVVLQLHIMHWQQRNGQEAFKPTEDILVTPPLFQLAPQRVQVIRFAIQAPMTFQTQQTYRVYVQEVVPEISAQSLLPKEQLRITLNISIPVFIQPQKLQPQFKWQAAWLDDNHVQLILYNTGNITLFTNEWQLFDKNQQALSKKKSTFLYILPKQNINLIAETQKRSDLVVHAKINAIATISHVQAT